MPRKRKQLRSEAVGGRGFRVQVRERRPGGNLYLRTGNQWKSLGHSDWELALEEGRKLAAIMLETNGAALRGRLTLTRLFAAYEADVINHRERHAYAEEERLRVDIWTAFLGPNRDVDTLDAPTLDRFVRARAAAAIQLPERRPLKKVRERTIHADIQFLQHVLEWATRFRTDVGERLLDSNPIDGYMPVTRDLSVRRPVATYDRFQAVLAKADEADPQKLLKPFMMLVESLGWRVSAIGSLRACDVDLKPQGKAVYGRVHKRGEHDKKRRDRWVPLSADARAAIELLLERRPCVGQAFLFPTLRNSKKHWLRMHANYRLRIAEKLAGLEPLDGGAFHPYRRKWATERKHLPLKDVAAAGDWADEQTLLRCYITADEETMFTVMNEPRKLVNQ